MSVYVADIAYSTTLVAEACPECGVAHGIPKSLQQQMLDKPFAKSCYCPNGHQWHYTGKTEAQRLQEQLDSARRDAEHQRQQRVAEERKNRALRGELTKTKKRVSVGVCPCCNRTFENLARHMKGQHPEFASPEVQS